MMIRARHMWQSTNESKLLNSVPELSALNPLISYWIQAEKHIQTQANMRGHTWLYQNMFNLLVSSMCFVKITLVIVFVVGAQASDGMAGEGSLRT